MIRELVISRENLCTCSQFNEIMVGISRETQVRTSGTSKLKYLCLV